MTFSDRYGPWAVIAGASEGIGRAFVRKIASQGVSCILIARRESPLKALADEIRKESDVECVTVAVDLAAPEALACITTAIGSREVGLFISNAGADPTGSHFLDRKIEVWIEQVNRNIDTLLRCCSRASRAAA